ASIPLPPFLESQAAERPPRARRPWLLRWIRRSKRDRPAGSEKALAASRPPRSIPRRPAVRSVAGESGFGGLPLSSCCRTLQREEKARKRRLADWFPQRRQLTTRGQRPAVKFRALRAG